MHPARAGKPVKSAMNRMIGTIFTYLKGFCRPRVGLQVKSVLVLTAVVVVITAVGGGSYYAVVANGLAESRRCHVRALSESLAFSLRRALRDEDAGSLKRLADEFVYIDGVRDVLILDAEGNPVARSSSVTGAVIPMPPDRSPEVSETRRIEPGLFAVARPVVLEADGERQARLIGSVRLVVDTTPLAASLAEVRRAMALIAAVLVGAGLPLSCLLVGRVLVRPVRRLLMATTRFAGGDYSARAKLPRNDEIGELALAFDAMADEVSRSHAALVRANENLEAKVRGRTAKLRRVNRRLRNEIAEKEDFLRAVSHDLNAPLSNISGLTDSVVRRCGSELDADVRRRLDRIGANVKLAAGMLEDLLELSRVRMRPQRREPTDMYALVREVRDAFEFALQARGIELEIHDHMPVLNVEQRRLRQAFQNLIDNAVKYMHRGQGGKIEIGYRQRDGQHEFHIADNGPGLSDEERRKVFCVFQRAANPATAQVAGRGVGLALVKAVAANHDGDAWVDSVEGEGATFYLSLSAEATCRGSAAGRESFTAEQAEPVAVGAAFETTERT